MAITIGNETYSYNNTTKKFNCVETPLPINTELTIEDISQATQKIKNGIKEVELQLEQNQKSYEDTITLLTNQKNDLLIELEKATAKEEALTGLIQSNN